MQFPFKLAKNKEFDVNRFRHERGWLFDPSAGISDFQFKIELEDYAQMAGGELPRQWRTAALGMKRLRRTFRRGRGRRFRFADFDWWRREREYAERIEGAQTQIAFIIIDRAAANERSLETRWKIILRARRRADWNY